MTIDDSLPPDSDAILADVASVPNEVADPVEMVRRYVPADILDRYEVYSYRNAALILSEAHAVEFGELMEALRNFRITTSVIRKSGGNESEVPKLISSSLRPLGWHETIFRPIC